jgi:hypothetical protein
MSNDAPKRIKCVRILNDNFRTTFIGGQIVLTEGVARLPLDVKAEVIKVQKFTGFTPENDPFGEHDFGSFELDGELFFWKIDYYDTDMIGGSPDPGDPEKTRRVLTIMLNDEY